MTTILHVSASARKEGSLSRDLATRFLREWRSFESDVTIIERDVGSNPPPLISEDWIAAAFTEEDTRTNAQHDVLRLSDKLIDELRRADLLLISTPMYNYGMPASLKAWVDQVVRIDKTFSFDLERGDYPLEPILTGKSMILLTSSGEFGFAPGGVRESMNHLVPHLKSLSKYFGVNEFQHVGIEYQEFGDFRHRRSIEEAVERVFDIVHDHIKRRNSEAA